jgi:CheY-like chemotaxis protein
VLIVDDSVVVRRTLAKKLRAAGYRIREATNGRDALAVLHAGGISAVVTDLDMPRMTGTELLQEMKRHRQFSNIPVTVLTSRDDELTLSEIGQLEPAAILNKPVTEATITAIISSLCSVDILSS